MFGWKVNLAVALPESPTFWLLLFLVLFLHRYVRLIVNCVSHWRYKSYPIPDKPTFREKDVTVVIPTIHHNFEELRPSLESILATNPFELIIVTTTSKFDDLMKVSRTLNFPRIRIFSIPVANKRFQVCEALPYVTTPITIMADDDVTWPPTLIPWILAPFENEDIGGVGTCQRVRREEPGASLLRLASNWLGACYIERRNFEISATHHMDGGTSCMSGRTGAYRTSIFRDAMFLHSFRTERWRNYILNADDDNFVTRWLVSHNWKTWIQYEPECEIETTLEYGLRFLYQCSRWARSNWRSNWTSLVVERHVWKQQPWSTYALHIATFTSLAFVFDPLILASLWWGTANWNEVIRRYAFRIMLVFFAFTKVVKLLGLFRKNPVDILYLPLSIVFGYFHGLIKLYALFTLNMTTWGSRKDGDDNDNLRLAPWPRRCAILNNPPLEEVEIIRYMGEAERPMSPSKSKCKIVINDPSNSSAAPPTPPEEPASEKTPLL
ncbi:hypothetical protein MAPG_00449 [Magnaporthiopsis poae ATCC 64411]|uniref:Polysaccharide synthase Cps1p n=1 Tax=Magnaporthiopsis poae (strain ATCC 64411 / 73-15) TaxID=644358 RepID=A0A0C4DL15_MAGP6|nr:hypothetical protein MAPG_00449 [Magnaporthiopsis poae ATCC 64411]